MSARTKDEFDVLASVRHLIKVGKDKEFWRKREAEILAERARLNAEHG